MLKQVRYVKGVATSLVRRCGNRIGSRALDIQGRHKTGMSSLSDQLSGGPCTRGISNELWQDAVSIAYQSLHSPFVLSLAQGTLPRETFQHYIAQDVFYLQGFAKAYALALAKADSLDDEHYRVLSELLRGVQREVQLHKNFLIEWGLDPNDYAAPNQATTAYIDFLLNVADSSQGVAHVLAAMLPCSRLYGFIGCRVAAALPAHAHQYSSWIRTYSSPEYLALPAQKEVLLDAIAANTPFRELRALYRKAMQLEVDFFCGQPGTPAPRNISLLVADFDDTLTRGDTIGHLLSLSSDVAEREALASGGRAQAVAARAAAEQKVQQLGANYSTRFKALMRDLLPSEDESAAAAQVPGTPTTILAGVQPPRYPGSPTAEEALPSGRLHIETRVRRGGALEPAGQEGGAFDLEVVAALLHRVSDFDSEMNVAVEEAGVLAGIDADSIAAAARKVELQAGAREVLQRALAQNRRVHVVSVNWSADFIAAALQLPCHIASGSATSPGRRPQVVVHANQLEVASPSGNGQGGGVTTGRLLKRVQNARDKGQVFEELLMGDVGASPLHRSGSSSSLLHGPGTPSSSGRAWGESEGTAAPCTVYVGDSVSDVLPLLEADYGVVVGANPMLRRVLREFDVPLKPLCAAPLQPPLNGGSTPVLYEAADWLELSAFLFGPDPTPSAAAPHPGCTPRLAAQRQGPQAPLHVPRVLTVAGSDSGGGAGIQADLKACTALGVFGMSAVTALTAQNTHGVGAVHVTPLDHLQEQLEACLSDIGADVVKTGMLPSAECVEAVVGAVERWGVGTLVVDPVMVSTSGHQLAGGGAATAIKERLLPLATIVTPNVPEASALLDGMAINSIEDMKDAARKLLAMGPQWVLVKGGHLLEAPQQGGGRPLAVDVLCGAGGLCMELSDEAVRTANTHGTGCTLASAIAAELAKGKDVPSAVAAAKQFITEALHHSAALDIGSGPQKPFNPGYAIADWAAPAAACPRAVMDLRVYAVTDPHCNQKAGRTMEEAVRAACEGGTTILQLREKDCGGRDFLATALSVIQVARAYGVPVLINDRVDIAIAAGADGVHVGQSDIPAAAVRKLLGPNKIIGVSVKTAQEAAAAQAQGADYLGAGAVVPTQTKDSSAIGLQGLAAVCAATSLPVVSIGGVNADNAASTIHAGCAGVAVVSGIFSAPDPAEAAKKLLEVVNDALRARRSAA